ncbi:MAG: efflux RND transporter permease subunit, partial [Firmicutes bacterium]|nr:efflux RND transporter permease subunit [Bacillota bacterium]
SVGDAMVLATVVILFFLGHLLQSLVVALSMPLTFLGTFLAMKALHMELNLITLSALILSVGIVVDHAIVVVENILRHQEEFGKDPLRAAADGTAEIIQPLVVGTYTTVIVLVPLLFIGGFAGRIFGPLALTLILAFTISLLVSLTIIPVLTVLLSRTRWRRAEGLVRLGTRPWRRATEALKGFYLDVTQRALGRPAPTLGLAALSLVAGLLLLRLIGMEVLPRMDAGAFFIYLQTEPGTSLDQTGRIVAKVEELLAREPAVQRYSTQIGYEPGAHHFVESGTLGVNQAYINVTLTSRKSRNETVWDIQERLRRQIALLPGIDTFVVKEVGGTAIATTRAPIDIRISGPEQKVLTHLADLVTEKVSAVPGATNIYRSWSLNNPEIHLVVREERAAELGLTAAAIGTQVFTGLQGVGATTLEREAGRNITVMVQYEKAFRQSPRNIEDLPISTPAGARVPLRDVAHVTAAWGPTVITRENLEQSVDVLGFTRGRTFSHVIANIRRALREVPVPDGYRIEITGEQADLAESFADLRTALVLAIAGIYLLLVAQFRSFVHPVTIMAAAGGGGGGACLAVRRQGGLASRAAGLHSPRRHGGQQLHSAR